MSKERLFLDTAFIQAILNNRDQYYLSALKLLPRVKKAQEIWTTEAILMEVGNALSALNRQKVVNFIKQCYETENIKVINVTPGLFQGGLNLYESRQDKKWGLIDCISFTVMREQNLMAALTSDRHFIQAGFNALLISD
ncbi:MAG: type II toxin-antitoxin system VapC family toxin [Gomphosphaeria aponina SAG 52.96 = DSM 107014]|uniref:Type II toxin-antitoxin system VapC family toxin n=1 Tax=Gomphosphaeria aponina SAG 52.96 = DSM 107014 TaxID=1521640 RepID=A0A941GN70_9CHRO|nr:type II toxin-antitoxin system VapC family toxin [Gomphosphaeria aponina SAG 52.96 = DSM 107014]